MTLPVFTPARAPERSAKKSLKPRILLAEFGDGYTMSCPDGLNSVREMWDLSWPFLKRGDAEAIDDFLNACKGCQAFLYQIPGTRHQLKWTCEEWDYTLDAGPGLDSITAKFKQSFNLDT